ncbi:hypothetical protein [Flectobacillus major]|uniref:hypothetical protein n=1 Tax=Flectobacillus major TaxID=103 RepID=UPI00040F1530|nr:hypothetical protein [Flectobacillus major]
MAKQKEAESPNQNELTPNVNNEPSIGNLEAENGNIETPSVKVITVDADDLPQGTLDELSLKEIHKLYGLCNKYVMQLDTDDEDFKETMALMTKLRQKVDVFDPMEAVKQAFPIAGKILTSKTPAEKAQERLDKRQKEEDEKVAEARKKAEEEKKESGEEEETLESDKQ